jgi:hypothetical protein
METREEAEFDVDSKIFEHTYCQGRNNPPAIIMLSSMRRALLTRDWERPDNYRDDKESNYYAARVCIEHFRRNYPVRLLFFMPKIRQDGEVVIRKWMLAMA